MSHSTSARPSTMSGPSLEDAPLGLVRTLLAPVRPLAAREHRLGTFVAGLTLANVGMAIIGATQTTLFAPSGMGPVLQPVLAATACWHLVAYALARRGHVTAAAWCAVAAQLVVPVVTGIALGSRATSPMSTAAWLSLALLTAQIALGTRLVLAVGAIALVGAIGTLVAVGANAHAIGEASTFVVVATGTVLTYARHRDREEEDRQRQLRQRNAQLEELRATLEERVEARTRELEQKADELAEAHELTKANQALLLRTEKMAAVGRLTAGLAHELASPLSAVLAAVDDLGTLQREYAASIGDADVDHEDHREIAAEMNRATELARSASARAVTFVRGLRAHTRDPGPGAIERFDVAHIAEEAVDLLGHVARASKVSVRVVRIAPVWVRGVPSRLNQALTNLITNAIDATGEHRAGGTVEVLIDRDEHHALISVKDDGPGIPAAVLPRIYEPLFTTKPYGKGTGLGLVIVQEVVRDELGGSIDVATVPGGGTTFSIKLPVAPEPPHAA